MNQRSINNRRLSGLGDIWTWVGGVVDLIGSIFGGGRSALTSSDWQQIIPGNGLWSNRLRSYLSAHIHYDSDKNNVQSFTEYFIHENLYELSNGKFANLSTAPTSAEWSTITQNFYNLLSSEGSGTPGGTNQASIFSGDMGIIPLLLIGGIVFSVMSKKTSRRKAR